MGLASKVATLVDTRTMQKYHAHAQRVADLTPQFQHSSLDELASVSGELRGKLARGATLGSILPEAFAVCCVAAYHVAGMTYRDTQVLAGVALHSGSVVDMKTGEGKTLACVLPAYLNALTGDGVHIATANSYLAGRDARLMGDIYRALGLTCEAVLPQHDRQTRRNSYRADVTYGTATEFGFDYLRDHTATEPDTMVHRSTFHYIIVDEADSVLVDESSTPLVISGANDPDKSSVELIAQLVDEWVEDVDYQVDRELWTAWPEDPGLDKISAALGGGLLHTPGNPYIGVLHNAVKAKGLYRQGHEYLVTGDEIQVIDPHTGRVLDGRRYSGGLHQSLEAKEQVTVKADISAQATIAVHNYLRLYSRMAGMTGTTTGLNQELHSVYGLDVVRVPTFLPVARLDEEPRIYANNDAKLDALSRDVLTRVARGQPVLVGTNTVAESFEITNTLRSCGLAPEVLNATTPQSEADIISRAGTAGQLTVATNMAGRGTDIMLGGDPEKVSTDLVAFQAEYVKAAGGLCVLGTSLNMSARVDEQLRGRCGRQGDPGVAYFYYSLDDERLWDNAATEIPDVDSDERLPGRHLQHFNEAQAHAAGNAANMREQTRKYDDVLDSQRRTVYDERTQILLGSSGEDPLWDMTSSTLTGYIESWLADPDSDAQSLSEAATLLWPSFPVYPGSWSGTLTVWMFEQFQRRYKEIRQAWESQAGFGGWSLYSQRILISCIDEGWRRHLDAVEGLRDVVQLRAAAGRDVQIEYAAEASLLYEEMRLMVKELAARFLFARGEPDQ